MKQPCVIKLIWPEKADAWSSVYSFVAVIYHTLTDEPPFVRDRLFEAVIAYTAEQVVPLCNIHPPSLGCPMKTERF